MSDFASGGARTVANLAALTLIVLGGAFALDILTVKGGGSSWALCRILPTVIDVLGHALGLIVFAVGLTYWAFTAFRDGTGLALTLGGIFLTVLPMAFVNLLGVTCPGL